MIEIKKLLLLRFSVFILIIIGESNTPNKIIQNMDF